MHNTSQHTFHIPVLGLGYSIDTPMKVARFGIPSVISIMDDELIEKMRKYHSDISHEIFVPIADTEHDYRAKRITAYLNLAQKVVAAQIENLKKLPFGEENDLKKYFELLPGDSPLKSRYETVCQITDAEKKLAGQEELRQSIEPGSIDVNIMSKVDRLRAEETAPESSDAMAALRGFANSNLEGAIVFSAGYNPRLFAYLEQFKDFFPDEAGKLKKRIILKVSDYRSAHVQGKLLAKKGIWVSEFRIESGLNCGGHAFPTDGLLLGPILEEFKNKREELRAELFELCQRSLVQKGKTSFTQPPKLKVTAQGGIGTSEEHRFLIEHYSLDGTGWGSPFLLVPEATNVDSNTLNSLSTAEKSDYYLSHASPLGIPFNNFHKSTSEQQRKERIAKNRPGSPCYKKFLSSDTEFTETPICTASREYQFQKIKLLKERQLSETDYQKEFDRITEKDCLCEGLGSSALIKNKLKLSHSLKAVAVCPGPNLAYFSGIFTLADMVGHIYGRCDLLNSLDRSNLFMNELEMYVAYFKKEFQNLTDARRLKYAETFRENLLRGISYYKTLFSRINKEKKYYLVEIGDQLDRAMTVLNENFGSAGNRFEKSILME